MNREKIESKIKELNSMRAFQQKHLREIKEKHQNKEISDIKFDKHKDKIDSKIDKIKHQIRELEEEAEHLKHE